VIVDIVVLDNLKLFLIQAIGDVGRALLVFALGIDVLLLSNIDLVVDVASHENIFSLDKLLELSYCFYAS
jgi:hypothetical protein